MKLYIQSDCRITLTGLKDTLSGELIQDAVVRGALYRNDQIFATLNFAPVDDTPGDYFVLVPNATEIKEKDGITYSLVVTVTYNLKKITIKEPIEPVFLTKTIS